jgi:hypothetical protein
MSISINRKVSVTGGTIAGPVTITGATSATLNLGTSQLNSTGGNLTLYSATDQNVALSATGAGNTYIGNLGTGSTNTGKLVVNGTSVIKSVRTATGSAAIGNVTAGSTATVDVTVTGAAVGDTVLFNTTNGASYPAGLIVSADVITADSVRVQINNPTGSTINAGTRSFRVTVTSF